MLLFINCKQFLEKIINVFNIFKAFNYFKNSILYPSYIKNCILYNKKYNIEISKEQILIKIHGDEIKVDKKEVIELYKV